ncbi:MAG TPA: flagellar basal body P-ring protein FlgI [Acidobacteriota bacterium]|nr:flagellar basal body P-ring protein FlgI [Acidobacteriota bacterium]
MKRRWLYLICLVFFGIGSISDSPAASSRIKDIAAFEGVRVNQLVGYGLVVGLNGTGDRSQTFFSTQTLANMLERSGVSVNATQVRVKNIAAVMVTADLPTDIRPGGQVDVTVSSIGDAQSIQGGVLIMTPLLAADNQVYVTAQGQVVLGGFSAGGGGNKVQMNHPTVGRIPNGGLVEKDVLVELNGRSKLRLVLNRSDFTTASRAVRAINETSGAEIASARDGRTIEIQVPDKYTQHIVEFISMVENAKTDIDSPARVVLNEKTGTIIFGKDVKIAEVSIIHGSLSLQVGTTYAVSQPEGFSKGETAVVPEKTVTVQEDKGRSVMLREGASVEEVVRALNSIGAGPRDVIAILQAIKAQGALQAELEII